MNISEVERKPYLSFSTAKKLLENPINQAFYKIHGPQKKKDPMEFGSLVDVLLTDPDSFGSQYHIVEGRAENGATKEGKAAKAEAEEMGKVLAKASKLEGARECVKNIMSHPIAGRSFNSLEAVTQVKLEQSIDDIPCLGFADLWDPENKILLDLKAFTPTVFEKAARTIFDRKMHLQLWMYQCMLNQADIEIDRAGWLVVGNEAPYHVEVWWMDEAWDELALGLFKSAACRYREYQSFDPSVFDAEYEITPLHWMK